MAELHKISWLNGHGEMKGDTWNPFPGCEHCSPGCKNCYAEDVGKRLACMGQEDYVRVMRSTSGVNAGPIARWSGRVAEGDLRKPLKRRKPTVWFTQSMGDLFYKRVTDAQRTAVWDVMVNTVRHKYMVLTKRAKAMRQAFESGKLHVLPNVALGVTVEDQDHVDRAYELAETFGIDCFLSVEPMLTPVKIESEVLCHMKLVIIGAESGPDRRPCQNEWIEALVADCDEVGVPVHVKQIHQDGKLVKDVRKFPEELQQRDCMEWSMDQ